MNTSTAVQQLAALAQESRLNLFKEFIQAGAAGVNPGLLSKRLAIPQATLSFHLKELRQAGLVSVRQDGRYKFYSADFDAMKGLIGFLLENCCSESTDSEKCEETPCSLTP